MHSGSSVFRRSDAFKELNNITNWWLKHSPDIQQGGFFGEIDFLGSPVPGANKGIILNSRILWFCSERCLFDPDFDNKAECRSAADRAFQYLLDRFDDKEHGGSVWELAADGTLINGKKQIYALCFCIYAFITYYRLTSNLVALGKSLEYFHLIETHARDRDLGGYFEAFSQQWQVLDDVRLSETDMNAPKTMNTHLHLLEAYTALHSVVANAETEEALRNTIELFCEYFIDQQSGHLRLFFDAQWNSLSSQVSFGHDIETSWLLWEAAEVLDDPALSGRLKPIIFNMADACQREGTGGAGQLCDEYEPETDHRSETGIWWVQAEALVGFLNAFNLTGEQRFRDAYEKVWLYIKTHHIDQIAGEWHWLSSAHESDIRSQYKAGFWKAPYHNGRAMMEVCKLFDTPGEN